MIWRFDENFFFKHPLDKPARWKWHRWFAWRPVRLQSGEFAWMETVERCMFGGTNSEGDNWGYQYRRRNGRLRNRGDRV